MIRALCTHQHVILELLLSLDLLSCFFLPLKQFPLIVYPLHLRNLINHSYHKKLTVWNLPKKKNRSTSWELSSAPGLHPTAHCHRLGAAFFCLWMISCFSPTNKLFSRIVYPVHLIGVNLGNHINYHKGLHEVLHAIFSDNAGQHRLWLRHDDCL